MLYLWFSKKEEQMAREIKLRIVDDYGVTWLWNGEWIDVDYEGWGVNGSGYAADTFDEVVEVLIDGGYLEG
jgi:hypothetical protein